eukprot:11841644-Alexandrium_andersonii.AAC.1
MFDSSCCHVGFKTPRGLRAPFLPGPCLLVQAIRRPQVYRVVGTATSSARRPCCMSEVRVVLVVGAAPARKRRAPE